MKKLHILNLLNIFHFWCGLFLQDIWQQWRQTSRQLCNCLKEY